MSVPADQLRAAVLADQPVKDFPLVVADTVFSIPSKPYIRRFGVRLTELWFGAGIKWKLESWECNHFSLLACALAKLDHGQHGDLKTSLAVGFAIVMTDTLIHAVVAAVHEEGGKLRLHYYEPQQEGDTCMREFSLPVRRCLFAYF